MLHSTFELANDKVKLSQIKLHHRTYPPKLKIQEMTPHNYTEEGDENGMRKRVGGKKFRKRNI